MFINHDLTSLISIVQNYLADTRITLEKSYSHLEWKGSARSVFDSKFAQLNSDFNRTCEYIEHIFHRSKNLQNSLENIHAQSYRLEAL